MIGQVFDCWGYNQILLEWDGAAVPGKNVPAHGITGLKNQKKKKRRFTQKLHIFTYYSCLSA